MKNNTDNNVKQELSNINCKDFFDNSTIRGKLDISDKKTPMYYNCILHKDNFNFSVKKITFHQLIYNILTTNIIL